MEAPRYTAKEIEDGLYCGMDPDVELVAAQYYDALRAELARVKAESLRVVVGGERCALSDCRTKFYIQPSCCHDTTVTPNNIQADFRRHPDTTVLPVRLKRWEDE